MKKIISRIILTLIVCALFVLPMLIKLNCKTEVEASGQSRLYNPESEFFNPPGEIIVDRQTGVEYWYIHGTGQKPAVVTVLLDADGKPVIYKGE